MFIITKLFLIFIRQRGLACSISVERQNGTVGSRKRVTKRNRIVRYTPMMLIIVLSSSIHSTGLSKDQAKLEYVRTSKKVLSEILSQSMDLFSMAQTVKGVLPQVPIDVIRRDLIVTNNVDETITRLLDGTVYYDAEAEPVPLPVKKEEPAKKTTTSDKAATDKDASSTSAKESSQSNASQSDPVKTEKELKTISPMVYSTKASTFEKDPQLRMKSYQERKKQLLEVARAHYIEKHGLNQ